MATFAIGDVQGCYDTLQCLLANTPFDAERDRLWSVGDLVNRGPNSLEVLRWAKNCAPLTSVLGNHDLHLLARASGLAKAKRRDTLDAVLEAPDRESLLTWLREQPILHRQGNVMLVHGGLHPSWTVGEAEELAREIEETLRCPQGIELLKSLGEKLPERWSPDLKGIPRLRLAMKIFTSIRIFAPDGDMAFNFSGAPGMAPLGYLPWFAVPGRRTAEATIVFGHWAALGLKIAPGIIALDSGCVWGRELTAVRIEDQAVFQEPNAETET